MSGPKCSEWEVQENRGRIERACNPALKEAEVLAAEIKPLAIDVESRRVAIGAAPRLGAVASAANGARSRSGCCRTTRCRAWHCAVSVVFSTACPRTFLALIANV